MDHEDLQMQEALKNNQRQSKYLNQENYQIQEASEEYEQDDKNYSSELKKQQ